MLVSQISAVSKQLKGAWPPEEEEAMTVCWKALVPEMKSKNMSTKQPIQ